MSTIDEIKRLHSLLTDGAISNQEFEMLKQNLLADSNKNNLEASKKEELSPSILKKDIKIDASGATINLKKIVLKKITCSNCGAELLFDPKTQLKICNFCGSNFEIKNSVNEEAYIPDGIVPFTITKERYEAGALAWLSEGDYTPTDILESSVFSSTNGLYIPVWFYGGRYKGNWSASSGYDYEQEYNVKLNGQIYTRVRIVTDWRPSSGGCDGDLNVLGFASKDYKSELVVFTYLAAIKRNNIKPFDSGYTSGFNLMEYNNHNHEKTWERYGKISARTYVESQVGNRIPGDHYKDFHVEAVYDKENPILIYIPVWMNYYKYNGQEYHLIMDGQNSERIIGKRPVDDKIKSKSEYFSKIFKYWWIVVAAWFTLGVFIVMYRDDEGGRNFNAGEQAFFENGLYVFLILLTIWPLLKLAGNMQKKAVINNAQKRRQQILVNTKKIKN